MVLGGKLLEGLRPRRQPRWCVHFVNQRAAATARIDCRLRGVCIARDHDAAIRRIEAIPLTFYGMLCDKRSDRHVRVLVDDAGGDLVRIHVVTSGNPR